MIGPYEITDPRTRPCELCDQTAYGRIMVELHGGSLWVCGPCYLAIQSNRDKPYSQVMERLSMRACGYHVTAKMARLTR